MSEPAATVQVYQLKIVLRGVSPLVWRRVLVHSDATIAHLHHVIQAVMGWEDEHLHCFRIHGKDGGGKPMLHDGENRRMSQIDADNG